MKKITFLLFALIAGTAFGQDSNTADATVTADIVSPITVSHKSGSLNFGKVLRSNSGIVVLSPANDRTSATTGLIIESSASSVPTFTVNAALDYSYSVSIPDITLINGGSSLEVTDFTHNLPDTNGTGGNVDFQVGASLTVESTDADGAYSGTATVTVNYN